MADPLAVIFAAGFGETARRDEGYVPKIMLPVGKVFNKMIIKSFMKKLVELAEADAPS